MRGATARGRKTAGAVLETASQANLQEARKPLRAPDAVLVTDGGTGCPGCARSLGVQHEAVNRAAPARQPPHPDDQPAPPAAAAVPAAVPRRGDQVPGQPSALASGDRSGQPALYAGLPARLLPGTPMHNTFRELSQTETVSRPRQTFESVVMIRASPRVADEKVMRPHGYSLDPNLPDVAGIELPQGSSNRLDEVHRMAVRRVNFFHCLLQREITVNLMHETVAFSPQFEERLSIASFGVAFGTSGQGRRAARRRAWT